MIRSRGFEDKMRRQRFDAKTLDNLFRRRIEAGANCPPFVSQAILQTAKEVFPLDPETVASQIGLGQVKLLVVAANESAGKALDACQKVTVCLTLDANKDDFEIRVRRGVIGLRRARLLRLASEAREQGGLLSHEDLAFRLLNCSLRTIVRDIHILRRAGVEVPTRGQQQDIGPGQTHRVQAVRLFLQGKEPNEIAHRLYHTLGSIENYLTTFARVVFLARKGYGDDEIAFIIQRSSVLVAAYRQLLADFQGQRSVQARLRQICDRVQPAENAEKGGKKGGRQP
jgi:DNA-binding NarL/FixJ family response regulator